MVVVADTSPLNYLVLIGEAEVLPRLYGEVVIPQAVLLELQHTAAPRAAADWIAAPPPWLIVDRTRPPISSLGEDLDPGEREAIALAHGMEGDVLLLIDDAKGREVAERLKIETTGTLGVLDAAAGKGLLNLPAALQRLQSTNFHVNSRLIQFLLDRDDRRKAGGAG
jgi:predicted nucleic acid-binding protein